MTVVPLHLSGPPERRFDLLLLGDGFTAAELPGFHRLAARVTEAVLSTPPFSAHRGRINVWRRDLVSAESGIAARGVRRRTALGARHDFLSPHAIGSPFPWRLWRACRGAPHDVVMVLANSPRRGGWALPFTRTGYAAFPPGPDSSQSSPVFGSPPFDPGYPGSAEAYAVDTFLHELGHACAGLGDEYAVELTAHVGRTARLFTAALAVARAGERVLGFAPFPNTTFRPERPPWRATTPPVEGALGLRRGAYRSAEHCKMRAERHPFCAVCADAIERRALDRFAPNEEPRVSRRAAYDATVTAYRYTFLPLWKLFGRAHERWLLGRLAALPAAAVLDAGTGTGWWAGIAARAFPASRVVGVDFSPRYLEVARRELGAVPNLRFHEADVAALPFADATYDAVVCSRVLDTIPARGETLAELRRVLRPGGELLLFLKGAARWPDRVLRTGLRALGRSPRGIWHPEPLHLTLEAEAARHGFRVVDRHQTSLMTRAALEAV